MQDMWQSLCPKIIYVHPPTTVRKGAEVQLHSLRQEIQVQTQTAIASYIKCTRAVMKTTMKTMQQQRLAI